MDIRLLFRHDVLTVRPPHLSTCKIWLESVDWGFFTNTWYYYHCYYYYYYYYYCYYLLRARQQRDDFV